MKENVTSEEVCLSSPSPSPRQRVARFCLGAFPFSFLTTRVASSRGDDPHYIYGYAHIFIMIFNVKHRIIHLDGRTYKNSGRILVSGIVLCNNVLVNGN